MIYSKFLILRNKLVKVQEMTLNDDLDLDSCGGVAWGAFFLV